MLANPPYPYHTACGRNLLISPPSISCTFEFDRSTPWTFYPTHLLTHISSPLSQSGLLFPSLRSLPSPRSFIVTFAFSCIPYPPFWSLPIYLSPIRRIPGLLRLPANFFSKHARAKTYCLKYSLPLATLSLSLPRRRLGRTPLVAVLLFFSCRIRASSSIFVPVGMRQWNGSFLACLVKARCVGSGAE